jgi:NAD(P)H-binding
VRVFVAGATGAIDTQLIPQLVGAAHEVIGMTRSPAKTDALRALGARPVVADALDPDAVAGAVAETEPEAISGITTPHRGCLHASGGCPSIAWRTTAMRFRGTPTSPCEGRSPARVPTCG